MKNILGFIIENILKKNIFLLILLILSMLIEAALAVSSVITIVPFVEIVLNPELQNLNKITAFILKIFDKLNISGNYFSFGILFFLTNLIKALVSLKVLQIILKIKFRIIKSFRMSLLNSSLSSKWKFFSGIGRGKLMNSLNEELNKISDFFSEIATAISYIIQICAYLILPFILNYKITLTVIIFTFVLLIPFVFLNKILLKLGKENIAAGNSVIGLINESLQAAKVIISYGNKNKSLNKIGKQTENYNKTAIRQRLLQSLSSNAFKPIAILILIITFGYVGNIKANLSYLAAIFWSLYSSLPLLAIVLRSNLRLATYFPSLQQYSELKNRSILFKESYGKEKVSKIINSIKIKNIYFNYEKKENIIENLSLEINANKITSIVGKSGSGKSTISDILIGLQDIKKGEIFFDDKKLDDLDLNFLREKISLVPQEPILFYDTIKNNLTWSKTDASENDIIDSLKLANAYDFVMKLPKKLETVVGERGTELSGGERQRIVLARAFLRNPTLLILDEATSGLDKISENKIKESILSISKNTTILIIAHKSPLIEASNYIYVLRDKKIAEEGTYNKLKENPNSAFNLINY